VSQAKDMFGGRLTQDFVAEKLCVSDFNKLMELDFPNMNIRSIDLGHGDTFLNLRRWATASLPSCASTHLAILLPSNKYKAHQDIQNGCQTHETYQHSLIQCMYLLNFWP